MSRLNCLLGINIAWCCYSKMQLLCYFFRRLHYVQLPFVLLNKLIRHIDSLLFSNGLSCVISINTMDFETASKTVQILKNGADLQKPVDLNLHCFLETRV